MRHSLKLPQTGSVKEFEISEIPKPILVGRDDRIVAAENELREPNLEKTLSRVLGENK